MVLPILIWQHLPEAPSPRKRVLKRRRLNLQQSTANGSHRNDTRSAQIDPRAKRARAIKRLWKTMQSLPLIFSLGSKRFTRRLKVTEDSLVSPEPTVDFLKQCEKTLNAMLRQSWRAHPMNRQRATGILNQYFNHKDSSFRPKALNTNVLATLLATMYWQGCRHPAQLKQRPLHPPTSVVRWLSQFSVIEQCTSQRQILDGLVEEIRVVSHVCLVLIKTMRALYKAPKLFPELVQMARNREFFE